MGGTVDSPTPMVPISSDSTSVMSSSLPNCVDSVIAATQPAVPPPAMTTFLTAAGCGFRVFHQNPLRGGIMGNFAERSHPVSQYPGPAPLQYRGQPWSSQLRLLISSFALPLSCAS